MSDDVTIQELEENLRKLTDLVAAFNLGIQYNEALVGLHNLPGVGTSAEILVHPILKDAVVKAAETIPDARTSVITNEKTGFALIIVRRRRQQG